MCCFLLSCPSLSVLILVLEEEVEPGVRYYDVVERSIALAKTCQTYPDDHILIETAEIMEPMNTLKLGN